MYNANLPFLQKDVKFHLVEPPSVWLSRTILPLQRAPSVDSLGASQSHSGPLIPTTKVHRYIILYYVEMKEDTYVQ